MSFIIHFSPGGKFSRAVTGTLLALSLGACSADEAPPPARGEVPQVVTAVASQAVVSGRVVDFAGAPVAAAVVAMAETGNLTMTDGDGAFVLNVPADSTVTLQIAAPGFAMTHLAALQVLAGHAAGGTVIRLATPAKLDELNTGTRMVPTGYGVVAVELRSKNGHCTPEGGHIVLTPAALGTVMYTGGGSSDPDPTLSVAEASDDISAFIIGALPAGGAANLVAEKPGCMPVTFPVDTGDRVHTGKFRIAAGALTQITLFVD
jgi:hypothetical protein